MLVFSCYQFFCTLKLSGPRSHGEGDAGTFLGWCYPKLPCNDEPRFVQPLRGDEK